MNARSASTARWHTLCDLVGHVGSHEAVTIVAAALDTHPGRVFTPMDLAGLVAGLVRDATQGFEVWKPAPQMVDNYCRHALTRGGVVEPLTVASTSSRMRGQPARAYRSTGTRRVRTWLRATIQSLAANEVVVNRPGRRDVTIASSWVEPIRDLLRDLTAAHATAAHHSVRDDGSHRSPEPESQSGLWLGMLNNPDAVAALLDKTQRWSSAIIGQRQGTTVTSADIHEIIRSRPDPISANDIVDVLTRSGRPITRSRVSVYLKALVQAGTIAALPGAGRIKPGTRGLGPDGYVANDPELPQARRTPQR